MEQAHFSPSIEAELSALRLSGFVVHSTLVAGPAGLSLVRGESTDDYPCVIFLMRSEDGTWSVPAYGEGPSWDEAARAALDALGAIPPD